MRLDYFRNDQGTGTSGTYDGFDRFGRVVNQKWYDYGAGALRDRYKYGYDRAGNRLWRENTLTSGKERIPRANDPLAILDYCTEPHDVTREEALREARHGGRPRKLIIHLLSAGSAGNENGRESKH